MNHQTANEIKRAIKPILDTITTARSQHDGLTLEGYQRLFKITKASLEAVVDQADKVIHAAESAHKLRPAELITKAATRLGMIPADINREQALCNGLLEAHQMKVTELGKQGFSDSEIENIVPFPKAKIDAHSAKIEGLIKAELAGIEAFLRDGPRYNADLLKNSDLSNLLLNATVPDSRPPVKLLIDELFSKGA